MELREIIAMEPEAWRKVATLDRGSLYVVAEMEHYVVELRKPVDLGAKVKEDEVEPCRIVWCSDLVHALEILGGRDPMEVMEVEPEVISVSGQLQMEFR
jgi:hypothetical protein